MGKNKLQERKQKQSILRCRYVAGERTHTHHTISLPRNAGKAQVPSAAAVAWTSSEKLCGWIVGRSRTVSRLSVQGPPYIYRFSVDWSIANWSAGIDLSF